MRKIWKYVDGSAGGKERERERDRGKEKKKK